MYTYSDADCEDGCEARHVSLVVFYQKDLFGDPGVAHCIEDGHADPEPDVKGCETSTKVPTLLHAAHARC